MRGKVGSKRYAQAVFEIACEENQLNEWLNSLKRITEVMQNTELKTVLENPKLSFDAKKQLVANCLEGIVPSALNLAYFLIVKRRAELAPLIEVEYKNLLDMYNGVKRAKVVTAVPIDETSKDSITNMLEKLTGYKIIVEPEVDSDIIGGMKVKIGDKLIDGSVKNRLEALKESLLT